MNIMEFHGDFIEITCAILCLLLILLVYFFKDIFKSRDASEPPGPWCWPIVGYYYKFLNTPAEKLFCDLAKDYGDIYQLRIGSRRVIVVNGFVANKEAQLTKGDDFANRPPMYCMKYLKRQGGILFDDYNNQYKETKRLLVEALDGATPKCKSGNKYYENIFNNAVEKFLKNIKKYEQKPLNISDEVVKAVGCVSINYLFGRTTKFDLKQMELIKNCATFLLPQTLNTQIPDFFPLAEFFFNKRDEPWKNCLTQIKQFVEDELLKHRKTSCKNSDPDVTDNLLQTYLSDHRISGILTDLLISSICKIHATMLWWVKIMVSNSDILARAQGEIDRITGRENSIELSDVSKLPYVEACILEIFRFNCILPIGILHYADKDRYLRGYLIPKNTTIIYNLWSVNKDKRIWKNPNEFDPTRFFIEETNQLDTSLTDKIYSFAGGLRHCPGQNLTRMTTFILGSNLLKHFNLKLESSKDFNKSSSSKHLVTLPVPFNVIVESRS